VHSDQQTRTKVYGIAAQRSIATSKREQKSTASRPSEVVRLGGESRRHEKKFARVRIG